jgi:predicted ATPase
MSKQSLDFQKSSTDDMAVSRVVPSPSVPSQPSLVSSPSTEETVNQKRVIRTPDQRLRVFVSSTLQELEDERSAAKAAITALRLSPVLFELGARAHPPRDLYRAYLEQSHIFVGIYWQRYGWVAPGESISGLEDEYQLSGDRPKLIYVKRPAPEREDGLTALLKKIKDHDQVSYKPFSTAQELRELLEQDLALLLTERFESSGQQTITEVSTKSQLPTPLTPLIGRADEVKAVRELLEDDTVRLVTLTGPGGIGKSRLGLEVARSLSKDYTDGAVYVPLSTIRDANLVMPTIAQTLHVGYRGEDSLEALTTALQSRHLLLFLDNFEQVIKAAPEVAALLAAAPNLNILLTSREALRLSGEHLFPVPPLSLPLDDRPVLEVLKASESVQLFVSRAQAVQPSFVLTHDNALTVAEITRRLDGLPLAIELAAARVKLMSPQAILERLEKRLELLQGGARDLPGRQRTLRDTIAWSFELLNEQEQELFTKLAVFRGGFTLEAAEKVACTDAGVGDVASLVDKSLVQMQDETEPRFTMLETVREYAFEKFIGSPFFAEVRSRHANYFLGFAEQGQPYQVGSERQAWLAGLEREHDNMRVAFAWAKDTGEAEFAVRLGWALSESFWVNARLQEGRTWMEDILAWGVTLKKEFQAKALAAAGYKAYFMNDVESATRYLEESLRLFHELGDTSTEALILPYLAVIYIAGGRQEQGNALMEQSLQLADRVDPWVALSMLTLAGRSATQQGNYALAKERLHKGLGEARNYGDKFLSAFFLCALGWVAAYERDVAEAASRLSESLELFLEFPYLDGVAHVLEGWSLASLERGRATSAAQFLAAATALRESINFPVWNAGQEEINTLEERVRRACGEAAFQASWAEGKKLSLEAALELFRKEVAAIQEQERS